MAASSPGMAAAQAAQGQPASAQCAIALNRFERVLRTGRREPTPPQRAEQRRFRRRQHPAIPAHRGDQNELSRIHGSLNNLPRRKAHKKSRSTSASGLPTMEDRATSTIVTGCRKSCWCNRKVSRSNRRARLRTTAGPNLRLVMTPTRGADPAGSGFQFAIKQPAASRRPPCFTSAKSRPSFKRRDRGKRNEGRAAAIENQTGVRRLRPARRRFRRMARPLRVALRLRKPCCRLRRTFDG